MNPKKVIISRTDSIGDVVLTLPVAGVIKAKYPNCKVLFLGKTYTQPIVETSVYIDEFLNWDELQQEDNPSKALKKLEADVFIHVFPNKKLARVVHKAKIPYRVGTTNRLFHLFTCNKKVAFSRKKSDLHEAQLNLKLLQPLAITDDLSLKELSSYLRLEKTQPLKPELQELIIKDKINVILHPKSKGSAKEWGLQNFANLIELLPQEKFEIFITGTKDEGELIGDNLPFDTPNVKSLIGKLTLNEFIAFIGNTDGLVAASTGPLHIAGALNKKAIGLFSPKRPIHPRRWRPLGINSEALVFDESCEKCSNNVSCNCIQKISPQQVVDLLKKIK